MGPTYTNATLNFSLPPSVAACPAVAVGSAAGATGVAVGSVVPQAVITSEPMIRRTRGSLYLTIVSPPCVLGVRGRGLGIRDRHQAIRNTEYAIRPPSIARPYSTT